MNTNSHEYSLDFSRWGGPVAVPPGSLALALLAQGSLCCGAGQGAGVFAAKSGLVAVEEVEDLGLVGEGAEGACEVGGVERRDAFSLVRDTSAEFCAVCARGGDAKFRAHGRIVADDFGEGGG